LEVGIKRLQKQNEFKPQIEKTRSWTERRLGLLCDGPVAAWVWSRGYWLWQSEQLKEKMNQKFHYVKQDIDQTCEQECIIS
jgi:hypothetical protein